MMLEIDFMKTSTLIKRIKDVGLSMLITGSGLSLPNQYLQDGKDGSAICMTIPRMTSIMSILITDQRKHIT